MQLVLLLGVAMVLVFGLAVREIVLFWRNRPGYRLRRLTLRLTMSGQLLYLFGSILIGVRIFHLDNPGAYPHLWAAFWGCITLLTGAIFCLVLADLRSLSEESYNASARLWQDMADTIAAHEPNHPKGS